MATPSERRRFQLLQQVGCVACAKDGRYSQGDVHHLLSGGRRIGHSATVCLCVWHHRGHPPGDMTNREAALHYGPSLHHEPREFRAVYGSDEDLLDWTNRQLERIESSIIGRSV